MKRVADEGEPVVVVPVVREPVEVRIALGIVPPDVADVLLAFEGNVPVPSMPLPLDYSTRLYRIRDRKSQSIRHRVSSFLTHHDAYARASRDRRDSDTSEREFDRLKS